jgi:hypothetical protein
VIAVFLSPATAAFPCCNPDDPCEKGDPVCWEYIDWMDGCENNLYNLRPSEYTRASANSEQKIRTTGWVQFVVPELRKTWAYFGLSYAPAPDPRITRCNYCIVVAYGGGIAVKEDGVRVFAGGDIAMPGDKLRIKYDGSNVSYYWIPSDATGIPDPFYVSSQPVDPVRLEEDGLQVDISVYDDRRYERPAFCYGDVRYCTPEFQPCTYVPEPCTPELPACPPENQ